MVGDPHCPRLFSLSTLPSPCRNNGRPLPSEEGPPYNFEEFYLKIEAIFLDCLGYLLHLRTSGLEPLEGVGCALVYCFVCADFARQRYGTCSLLAMYERFNTLNHEPPDLAPRTIDPSTQNPEPRTPRARPAPPSTLKTKPEASTPQP